MKKLNIILALLILVAWSAQSAVITNSLGQVVTTSVDENGLTVVTIAMPPDAASVGIRTRISLPGAWIDTNDVTDVSAYTPIDFGDIVIGKLGPGTNAIWMACGVSTNSWLRLGP